MTPCSPVCMYKTPSVCRFKTSPCVPAPRTHISTCARGVGIHGDVLNAHTEAFLNPHTGFFTFFQRAATHTHKQTPRPTTTHTTQHHNTQHHTETETQRDRDRQKQRETEKERQRKRDTTRQEERRQEKRREDREKRRERTRREKKQDKRRDKMKREREMKEKDVFFFEMLQDPQTRQMN